MLGAAGLFNFLLTAAIMGGIVTTAGIAGLFMLMTQRESKDRPLIPWGARARVEKARAAAEIAELEGRREAADIKRLALEPTRQKVVAAIHSGEELPEIPALNGATKKGDDLREAAYGSFVVNHP